MNVPKISNLKFRLANDTIKHVEKSTRCSIEELRTLTSDEVVDLMIKRGAKKKPNKVKEWFVNQYRKFGEKTGLLKKQYNIYTDID